MRVPNSARPVYRLLSRSNCAQRSTVSTVRSIHSITPRFQHVTPVLTTSTKSNTFSVKSASQPFNSARLYSTGSVPTEADVDVISIEDYHTFSDETMENILTAFEELGESVPDLDVELSQGVLSLDLPPNGSYVINKQPPNKQIWWSSPLSGPKRFDLVNGVWTSLRDGSTLQEALEEETKILTDARGLATVEFVLNE